MANKRRTRKKQKSALGAVFAILIALVLMGMLGYAILHLNDSRVAKYPVKYTEEIIAAANDNNIPPAYIASIIMAESSYNPEAVSSVGARGLMQIMPDTGIWIAGKFGEECTPEMLFDPNVNIRYGAWYLGFLMARYDGDIRCATAAYHAGQGTVDKWLADPEYSADGKTLTKIGYDSTNTYVDRVLKYYDYYSIEYEKLTVQ